MAFELDNQLDLFGSGKEQKNEVQRQYRPLLHSTFVDITKEYPRNILIVTNGFIQTEEGEPCVLYRYISGGPEIAKSVKNFNIQIDGKNRFKEYVVPRNIGEIEEHSG